MRNFTRNLIAVCLLTFTFVLYGLGQNQSVVVIHTGSANSKLASSGYGIAYGGPDKIVTALHVVNGKTQIRVVYGRRSADAVVEKVYPASDLALLSLKTPLGIPQAELYQSSPPLNTDLLYWEQPTGASSNSSKTTQITKVSPLNRIDPRLTADLAGFQKALCTDNSQPYPKLETLILKFGEPNIKKAHSGSPVTTGGSSNKVVGLIDGGDFPGTINSVVWAIPATEFKKLLEQGRAPSNPAQPCISQKLYGGVRSDNPFLSADQVQLARTMEAKRENPLTANNGGDNALIFTAEDRYSFEDVYASLDEEDQQYIQDLFESNEQYFEENEQVSVEDLFNSYIDVYFEERTGATIAFPYNAELHVEKEDGFPFSLIQASSPFGGIHMYAMVYQGEDTQDAFEMIEAFDQYLVSDGGAWVQDEDMEVYTENYLNDPDPYYNRQYGMVIYDEDDILTSEFYANQTINYSDFLGVSVEISDWDTLDDQKNERLMYYLMEVCAMLSDFPYY